MSKDDVKCEIKPNKLVIVQCIEEFMKLCNKVFSTSFKTNQELVNFMRRESLDTLQRNARALGVQSGHESEEI